MKNKLWLLISAAVLVIITLAALNFNRTANTLNIGVITDLTGPAAYWGESSRVGANLAVADLKKEGHEVNLLFEDHQLDATKALTSAQKLVNIDNVDAIYAEFNPAAISVGSFVKDKDLLYVYDAAVTSPLTGNSLAFKTYLDYQEGCKQVANRFKSEGFERIGVLKVNLEAGELCLSGVKEVYGDAAFVESFNLGDQDFRTQLLKLKERNVRAVIAAMFEGDTLNTLKVIKEQKLDMKYGTVEDSITRQVTSLYAKELEGSWSFGFGQVSPEFSNRISGEKLSTEYGAAVTYTHIMQMGRALGSCNGDLACVRQKIEASKPDATIEFEGFNQHMAIFNMTIKGR
ncbi:ABC transporter substrate-binding protein [Candidatus Woesearchaeota archaeon]|nr:ABC transporter substrate-binding protein [Candidatus Woesearchaeota archaeon]